MGNQEAALGHNNFTMATVKESLQHNGSIESARKDNSAKSNLAVDKIPSVSARIMTKSSELS